VLFVGSEGMLLADYYAAGSCIRRQNSPVISRRSRDSGLDRPPCRMDPSCKDRRADDLQFQLFRALAEAVLLGNVAYRAGAKLEWDAKALKATKLPGGGQVSEEGVSGRVGSVICRSRERRFPDPLNTQYYELGRIRWERQGMLIE